jgi:hypothetical protein
VSQPARELPFVHRLSCDVAARIHGTPPVDTPLLEMGSPRRRLVVLVLVLGLLGTGLATGLPSGSAQTLRSEDCRPGWVVDASGDVSRDENWLC